MEKLKQIINRLDSIDVTLKKLIRIMTIGSERLNKNFSDSQKKIVKIISDRDDKDRNKD